MHMVALAMGMAVFENFLVSLYKRFYFSEICKGAWQEFQVEGKLGRGMDIESMSECMEEWWTAWCSWIKRNIERMQE